MLLVVWQSEGKRRRLICLVGELAISVVYISWEAFVVFIIGVIVVVDVVIALIWH